MKAALNISILLNVGLLGGLVFVLVNERKEGAASALPALSEAGPPAPPLVAPPESPSSESMTLRWSQLATNDYGVYVANLRAIGCPEPTIGDIVKGEAERAFSRKRQQLRLDGSVAGRWSKQAELELVTSALGLGGPVAQPLAAEQITQSTPQSAAPLASAGERSLVAENSTPAQSLDPVPLLAAAPRYPLVYQNANLDVLGLTEGQKTTVRQLQQQFVADVSGSTQNSSDPAAQTPNPANPDITAPDYAARWKVAQQNADDALLAALGTQLYLAYQYQHYYTNFEQQILSAGGGPLTINPDQLAQ